MSKFYDEISKYYDEIFPVGRYQVELLKELSGDGKKDILDIACGNGGYSKSLADFGHKLTAIDLNPSMIDILNNKYKNIDGRVLNMLDLDKLEGKYDLVYCIGNSLVHLNNNEEILEFLTKTKEILKDNGRLLLQIINYDRILDRNIDELPTIEGDELRFVREYEYMEEDNKINFKTILEVKANKFENNEILLPIRSNDLIALLGGAGFKNIETYGNFKKEEYDSYNSYALVIIAQ